MNKREFMRMEFIGLEVETSSPNKGCISFTGKVVDETKNTFVISRGDRELIVPKLANEFRFTYQGNKIMIDGSEIQYRPEDRIKKIR